MADETKPQFTVGSDIEFFVSSRNSLHPSSFVPGEVICPYPKDSPQQTKYGKMHWDNVLLEVCPNHADNVKDFHDNVTQMIGYMVGQVNKNKCQLPPHSSAYITADLAKTPSAMVFGCDPDLNAYTRRVQRPDVSAAGNLRTAGGHVHIGIETDNMDEKILLAKLCDLYLGIPSVLLDRDTTRRRLYGKAGSFRPKPYGIEYRVLSNFWAFNDKHVNWIFEQVREVVELFRGMQEINEEKCDWMTNSVSKEIELIINSSDRARAKAYIKMSHICMP